MHPVSCHHCGTCVLVKKNSLAHTQVQWTSDTRQCAELSERAEHGVERAAVPTCTRLRASIEDAVRGGHVPIENAEEEPAR